jgi:NAD(P)-dependent dehydrogenase (short-subunit alcohol dehydrogenase family)
MNTTSDRSAVLITGASSGFGRHTAEAFLARGWRVYASLRDAAGRNAAAAAELRALGADVVELDVTDQASVDRAAAAIHASTPALDVVVNNAGTLFMGPVETFTPEAAERQFATNVFGVLRVNRAFLPPMRARRNGLIVFVSSVVGRFIMPGNGLYTSSKFAIEALAETSAYELATVGVDVAIVEPGAFATNIGNAIVWPDDQERLAGYGEVLAIGQKIGEQLAKAGSTRDARDVAHAIVHLATLPAGERPLRTVVPAEGRVTAINAALAPFQRETLETAGLASLIPKHAI